jgi:hypothetical protein
MRRKQSFPDKFFYLIFPNAAKIRRVFYVINRKSVNFRKIGAYVQPRRTDKRIITTYRQKIAVLYQADGNRAFTRPCGGFKIYGYKIIHK